MNTFLSYYHLVKEEGVLAFVRKAWGKVIFVFSLQLRIILWRFYVGKLPSDWYFLRSMSKNWDNFDELMEYYLCNSVSPAFIFLSENRDEYVSTLRKNYNVCTQETLRIANSICQHRFQFLGSTIEFNGSIDWHLDPESGRSWPKLYYEKMDEWLWSGKRLGDFKIPWELNRHQYFVTLGKAYWLTGDERYADECAEQILGWIAENPPGTGINWCSSLEIGVRLISWILAFHFFRDSQHFIAKAGKPFIKSLYQQAAFLRKNLTVDEEVRNNHIIGEAAGLVIVGSFFPEFKEAADWLKTGLEVFEQELTLQTFPDGVNKEQAISYHRFVLDFLLIIQILSLRGVIPVSEQRDRLLEEMLNYMMYAAMPDGRMPMIGDSDDGRGFILSECTALWDFRAWLAVGAVLYNRPDFKFVAQNFPEEAFWLLGPKGLMLFEQLESASPKQVSISFPLAGHYIIRDNWLSESDYAFFKSGSFGWGGDGFSAHSHCDLMSFVIIIRGVPLVVDSGTYKYHGPWRDQFRLTDSHNMMMIDGRDQAVPLAYFGWKDIPRAECLVWRENRVGGAMQVLTDAKHCREIYHPESGQWEVTDNIQGGGVHKLSWFFHFAPSLTLGKGDTSDKITVKVNGKPYAFVFPPEHVCVEIKEGWFSESYGVKVPNLVLQATWEGNLTSGGVGFTWKFIKIE